MPNHKLFKNVFENNNNSDHITIHQVFLKTADKMEVSVLLLF